MTRRNVREVLVIVDIGPCMQGSLNINMIKAEQLTEKKRSIV